MQVKGNVNAVSFLLTDAQTAMGAATDKSADGLEFASFLAKPSDSAEPIATASTVRKEAKQSDERQGTLNVEDGQKSTSRQTKSMKTENKQAVKEEADVNPTQQNVTVVSEETEVAPEDEKWVLELLGNLVQLVQDTFELPLEELPEKLEEFGMELQDLLSSDGMKDFFLNMHGADRSDLIVNEGLNEELTVLLTEVHAVYEQCEMDEAEVVQRITGEDLVQVFEDAVSV